MSLVHWLKAPLTLWHALIRNNPFSKTRVPVHHCSSGAKPSLHGLGFIALFIALWLHNQEQLPSSSLLLVLLAAMTIVLGLWWVWGRRFGWLVKLPTVMAHGSVGIVLLLAWTLEAQERLERRWPSEKNGEIHWITGSIDSMVQAGEFGVYFQFKADTNQKNSNVKAQKFKVSWSQALPGLSPGQRWRLQLKLNAPTGVLNFNGPDVTQFALQQQIDAYASVYRSKAELLALEAPRWGIRLPHVDAIRQRISEHLDYFSGPSAQRTVGIVKALSIGEQSAISSDDWRLFNQTGVSHLMSISGLHVTMMAAMCAFLFKVLWNLAARWLPMYTLPFLPNRRVDSWVCAILAAWGYCVLAGWGIPAQRTLFTLFVLGALIQKQTVRSQSEALFALQWVLFIILVLDSWAVLTVGFWLSFLAVAALMLQAIGGLKRQSAQPIKPAEKASFSNENRTSIRQSITQVVVSGSLNQWACTIGLLVPLFYFFGASSGVSPFANVVAIPLVSMIVTPLALLAAFIAMLWQSVFSAWPDLNPAWPLLALADLLLRHLLSYLEAVAGLRGFWFVSGELPLALAALLTLVILGALSLASIRRQVVIVGASLLSLWIWIVAGQAQLRTRDSWDLTFMDVGQGSSIVVQNKGQTMLIDPGPRRSLNQDSARSILLPYLASKQVRQIDLLVVTHQDVAHSGALQSVLSALPVNTVLASLPAHSYEQHLLDSKRLDNDQRVTVCKAGDSFALGDLNIQVLSPLAEPNNDHHVDDMSCVLLIEGYGSRVLLPADIRKKGQQRLLKEYGDQLRADVLAMPGQGSKTAFNEAFVLAVAPTYAVAQVGSASKGNRWRHPESVLPTYDEIGASVLRTDQHGAIKFQFSKGQDPVVTWARTLRARYWH